MGVEPSVKNSFFDPFHLFQLIQHTIHSPNPPGPDSQLKRLKIAVIGAGITGVTSAAHCIGHGFDVTIFESGPEGNLGGIWSKVNSTSGLQIHSLMYRFHPSVKWELAYPDQHEILGQVRQLWKRYLLESRTKFNTKVDKIYKDQDGRWIVNDAANGHFDGVISAVGTCGEPLIPDIKGMDRFEKPMCHSSQLTGKKAKGKTVLIIGGGASAVEALEFAYAEEAAKIYILARSEKWIIPRNALFEGLLTMNVFGQETVLSWIPETLLRKFFYRDLEDLVPANKGLFSGTPVVNSDVMDKLRSGKAEWVRCDILELTEKGVLVNKRSRGVAPGGPGQQDLIEGDMLIMATGFKRPDLSYLPQDCHEEPYGPPNWYLQIFPPNHPSLPCINCTYKDGIGSVGNWHIGIYTRIMLMFLVDPLTRPHPFFMKRWVDTTRLLKYMSPTPPLDFFTYSELHWWFMFCVFLSPFRWKWAVFVFFGLGFGFPAQVVELEHQISTLLGLGRMDGGCDVGRSI